MDIGKPERIREIVPAEEPAHAPEDLPFEDPVEEPERVEVPVG